MKAWWSEWWPAIALITLVMSIVGVPAGCVWRMESKREALEAECGMRPGDIVESVLDARRGMVTDYRGNAVWVRFAQPHAGTDVSLLGADGAISNTPYSVVRMACYELRLQVTENEGL